MKTKEYYIQKYEDRMDELYKELKEETIGDIDYACAIEFGETANAEEVVGYYYVYYELNPLGCWLDNIKGIDLTEQDKEVTRILKELANN